MNEIVTVWIFRQKINGHDNGIRKGIAMQKAVWRPSKYKYFKNIISLYVIFRSFSLVEGDSETKYKYMIIQWLKTTI